MTSNTNRDPALKYNRQPASGLFRIVSGTLLARFVITAVLLVGLLLTGEESEPFPAIATRTADTAQATSPTPAPGLSPQALEDLQAAPNISLAIDPEPLLLAPLPEDVADIAPEVDVAPEDDVLTPPEAPFSVGEALARYVLAIRSDLNSEYVANCIRHRNRNGAEADCPEDPAFTATTYQQEQALMDELFAVITRDVESAQISSRLERENQTLAALLEDPANRSALKASTRLALNNSYLAFLNGNPNPDVAAFNTMTDFINDYNRTTRRGAVQFRCQDGPCVYRIDSPKTP